MFMFFSKTALQHLVAGLFILMMAPMAMMPVTMMIMVEWRLGHCAAESK